MCKAYGALLEVTHKTGSLHEIEAEFDHNVVFAP